MSDTIVAQRSKVVTGEHRAQLFPWVKPYYQEPIVVSDAQGVSVRDVDGREYLDFFGGILTTSVGHCHPAVLEAVSEQMHKLGHTSTLYVTEQQIEVAKRLNGLAPSGPWRAVFTNSGTEAVESAVMAACIYTGRSEIIALRYAYSGRSFLATNITAHSNWRTLDTSIAGIKHAAAPYVYRCPLGPGLSEEEYTEYYIQDLVEVIETTTSGRPAAFMAETVQGVGGFIVPPRGYLARAAEVIRDYGGVFISDEVQTGFGRTGDKWFGVEHWDVVPDIMVMAKGIANGFPVGATLAREEIAEAWTSLSVSTYGGNPVSMAAAGATLDVMVSEDVPTRCAERGRQVRAGLEALQQEHAWIGDVRGMGLMQGMELVEDRASKTPYPAMAQAVLEAAKEEGLLVGTGGRYGQVVRMGPSMLITESEVADGLERLRRACRMAENSANGGRR